MKTLTAAIVSMLWAFTPKVQAQLPASASPAESPHAVVTLTPSQLRDLPDAPFLLVPAPGAGKLALHTSAVLTYDPGDGMGTASGTGSLELVEGDDEAHEAWGSFEDAVNGHVSYGVRVFPATVQTHFDSAHFNQPILLRYSGQAMAEGIASIDDPGADFAANDKVLVGTDGIVTINTVTMGAAATATLTTPPSAPIHIGDTDYGLGVRSFSFTSGGNGFAVGNDVTISCGDRDAVFTVVTLGAMNSIATATMLSPGQNCMTGAGQTVSGGDGSGATINVTAITGSGLALTFDRYLTVGGTQTLTVDLQYRRN